MRETSELTSTAEQTPSTFKLDLENGPVEEGSSVLMALVFVVCGCAQLYYWNMLLDMIGDITNEYFPHNTNLSDTLTAVYNTGNLLTALLVTWRGSLSIKLNVFAGLGLILSHLLTGLCVHFTSGTGGLVFFHLISLLAGSMCGLHQAGQYALASAMPKVLTGWVSQGNGLCGIVTFGLWMIFSEGPLKGNVLGCLWWSMGIGCALLLAATMATILLARRPDVASNLSHQRAQLLNERNDPDRPTYMQLLKQVWPIVLSIFFTFFITLMIYPAMGPFRWDYKSHTEANVLMGMFQIGDFVGRSMPLLAKWIPFMILQPKMLYGSVGGRLIFMLLFILMWKQSNVAAWSNYGWQIFIMLAMAITNGWFATCCFIHGPSRIEQPQYRGRVGSLVVVGLLLGIVVGLWTAKLVTIGD